MDDRHILESWKAIAAYLGHSEKTCRKWEHELGLPVHRLDDSAKAHVFAYTEELDRWKENKLKGEKRRKSGLLFAFARPSPRTRFWLVTAFALVLIVIAGFLFRRITSRTAEPGGARTVKSIAILAFTDLSPRKEYEYLCEGMVETLIDSLNKVEGLHVPARASSFYFKGKDAPPEEIGKKLKVDYVLEASVQADGEQLRVISRLVSVADGYQVWSEKYDRDRGDIFAVEDDIARGIVNALQIKVLGPPGALIVEPGTQNLEAYNLYLNGQYYMKKGWSAYVKAREFFEKALEKDPNYADAYVGIAVCNVSLAREGLARPRERCPQAKAAALKALEIDSHNPYALGILSYIKMNYDWDFSGAEKDIRKAIQLNPGNSFLHEIYANILLALARFEEGLAQVEIAERGGLRSPELTVGSTRFNNFYFARKYDLALDYLKKELELDPHNWGTYIMLVQVDLSMGRYEDARAANQRRREIIGTISRPDDYEPWCAMVYAHTGNPARAREILAIMKARFDDTFYPYHMLAWVSAALGDKDEAFYWLERAYQERTGMLCFLKVHPLADPLRDDPRFTDLLRRIGLEK